MTSFQDPTSGVGSPGQSFWPPLWGGRARPLPLVWLPKILIEVLVPINGSPCRLDHQPADAEKAGDRGQSTCVPLMDGTRGLLLQAGLPPPTELRVSWAWVQPQGCPSYCMSAGSLPHVPTSSWPLCEVCSHVDTKGYRCTGVRP